MCLTKVVALLVIASPAFTLAQDPNETATSFHDRVVDQVVLNDGTKLRGFAASEKPTRLFVRTQWLKDEAAAFYSAEVLPEIEKSLQASTNGLADLLQTEIERIEEAEVKNQQRAGLLKEIRDRLIPEEGAVPNYLVLEIPKVRLRRIDLQPNARRELGRLAILNEVPDFEQLSSKAVAARVQSIPESVRRTAAPAQPDDNVMLHRVLAAVDVQLGSATRLVQHGTMVTDESDQADPKALLSSLLGQNLQATLDELLNEGVGPAASSRDALPESAIRIADAKEQSTIVLSSFEFDVEGGSAAVHRRLFHKSEDQLWTLILSSHGDARASDLKPGQAEALQKDPQIQQIASLFESLGINNAQLSTAVQMGAVVQRAMDLAGQAFQTSVLDIIAAKDAVRSQPAPSIRLSETPPNRNE